MQPQTPNTGDSPTDNSTPASLAVPQTPAPHDYLHPIADKGQVAHNPQRVKLILSLIVALSILGVAAMVIIALFPSRSAAPSPPVTTKPTKTASSLTAKEVIAHVKVYFKGTETTKDPIGLPVMTSGESFYTVVPDITEMVSVAGPVASTKATQQLAAIEKSLDYDKLTMQVMSDGTSGTNYLADFTHADVICEVDVVKPTDKTADQQFAVKCLDIAAYVSTASAQKPFVALYTPLTATTAHYGFVGKPAISRSQTNGYQLAELQVSTVIDHKMTTSGKYAEYYQTPDGLWHYFNDRDNTIPTVCEQYTTYDLQAAYVGQPCRSLTKGIMSTVPAPKKQQ